MNMLATVAKFVFEAALKALPLLFKGLSKLAGFIAADRSIIGMFVTGLVLVFTGQAWAAILLFAKAGFLLFASVFGFRLATQGVKVTMMPLIPQRATPQPVATPIIVTSQAAPDPTEYPASS